MKQNQIDHYGAHLSNGLWFLVQDDEQNERGLSNVRSNLEVKTHRRLPPTHSIRLGVGELNDSERATLESLKKSTLGKLLLPNPNNAGKVVYVEDSTGLTEGAYRAANLSSHTSIPIRPSFSVSLAEARGQARLTNVQPFIISDVTASWMTKHGSEILSLFRAGTRPLILVGASDVVLPRSVRRVKGTAFRKVKNESVETLRRIGSVALKEWFNEQR